MHWAAYSFVYSYEGDSDMECDFNNPFNQNFDPATIVQNNTLNVTKVALLLKEQLSCKSIVLR